MSQVIDAMLYLLYKKGVISIEEYNIILLQTYNGADPNKIADAIRKVADGI